MRFRLAPDPALLLRARERIRDYLRMHCAGDGLVDDVLLCVDEACANVITHSGSDEEMRVSLGIEGATLTVEVKDAGRGFDVASFDPEAVPDPMSMGGRGLFMMSRMMDDLRLHTPPDGGLTVRMVKRAVEGCPVGSLESGLAVVAGTPQSTHREIRMRALLEEIDEAFLALDWQYRYVYANSAALKMTGTSLAELLGRTPWEVFPELVDTPLAAHYRDAMELGQPSIFEHRSVVDRDWYEVRIYPTAAGVSVYYRQINERKYVEQELANSHMRLATILGTISDAFFTLDRRWRLTFVNDRAAAYFQRTKEELLGRSFLALFPDMAGSIFELSKRKAMEEGRTAAFEAYYEPLGLWVEERDYPSPDGVTVLFSDVTERKQAEFEHQQALEELRTQGEELRSQGEELQAQALEIESSNAGLAASRGAYQRLFTEMTSGFAVHEIVSDSEGRPVDYRFLEVNRAFEELTGLRANDLIGHTAREVLPGREPLWIEVCGNVAQTGRQATFDHYSIALDRQYEVVAYSPSPGKFATIFNDVTARLRAEEGLRLRADLAEALNAIDNLVHSKLDLDVIMQRGLEEGVRALSVDTGAIEIREESCWVVSYQTGFSPGDVGLRLSDLEAPNATRAAAILEPFAIADMASDPSLDVGFVHIHAVRSVLAVPLVAKGSAMGCLLLYGKTPRNFEDAEIDFARKLGATVSLALENARLLARETESARLATALNEINRLINSTLDTKAIMQTVVERAVAVVEADSVMVALKHGDDWVAEYGYPEVPGVIHESVSTDEVPFVVTAVTERRPIAIDDCEADPRCFPEVQARFGVRSVLCIPLIVREEVLGVVFFNRHAAATRFEPRTVEFAGQLASAMSLALENARLYEEQQRIATTLQESFKHPLPDVPGIELGIVSQTAYEPELVGGDFSEVFELADGRIAVLIGDVAGKGIKAAGHTETVRSTVRAFAAVNPSPAFVLAKTSDVLLRYDSEEPHVTAFMVVLDPRTGHMLYASAGHPAPVHVTPSACRQLGVMFGPPLGSFPSHYREEHLWLSLDDYLLFYTDGVTEARRGSQQYGEKRLANLACRLRGLSAQEFADGVRAAALEFAGSLKDDLQVVCLRLA